MSGRKGAPQLDSWRRSAEFREIARRQCQKMNAQHWEGPRCGAARKSDGEPCQKPPMTNGRCKLHGGNTPKGENWHVRQWPRRTDPKAMAKLDRKLKDQDRAARKRARRLAAMTPAERERFDNWHKARQPGAAVARQRARDERRQNAEFRDRAAITPRAPSLELQVIADELSDLRQRLADIQTDKGVFS